MDREQYRNPQASLGYQNLNPPDIVRKASDTAKNQINFQEWIALGIFEDEDVSIYDHFIINSDSEEDEKEEIKTENKSKDVKTTKQRIDLNREKEVKITELRSGKKPLVKNDDIKRKIVTETETEQIIEGIKVRSTKETIDKKPQDKAFGDVIEKRTDEYKAKASSKHRKRKRKRKDEGNRLKKIKHKIETSDSDKSFQIESGHTTRDGDSGCPSPTDNYYEEDYKKKIKNEYTHPASSIKQEFPFIYGVYFCDVCSLTLNSHTTYQSHVAGKKHKKNLDAKNVAQTVAESYVPIKPTSKCPNYSGTYEHANFPSTSFIQKHSFKMPSTSSRDQNSSSKQGADFSELFKSFSVPDPSKAGFFCIICNSHSNSSSMWEAHISGKRHIANLKKAPGSAPSKSRNFPAPPGTVARLYSQLKGVYEPIVGLDQIREIQRLDVDSVSYTCFLCGGNLICEDEIVDHILLTKHREKYLEKINYPELETLCSCQMSVRCSVIAELCERVEAEQGRGEPEVYYAKNSLEKI